MPQNIIETPTKGTTLSVPIGTDQRKASSLMAAWQAIGDRLKFAEDLGDLLAVFLSGGAAALSNNLAWTIADGKIFSFAKGAGGLGSVVSFLSSIVVRFDGNVVGKLFTAGQEGYANTKTLRVTAGSGDFALQSIGYNLCILSGLSGDRTAELDVPAAGLDGLTMRIVNHSPTYFVHYKNSGGSIMGNSLKYTASQMFSVDLLWVEAEGLWHITGYGAYTP